MYHRALQRPGDPPETRGPKGATRVPRTMLCRPRSSCHPPPTRVPTCIPPKAPGAELQMPAMRGAHCPVSVYGVPAMVLSACTCTDKPMTTTKNAAPPCKPASCMLTESPPLVPRAERPPGGSQGPGPRQSGPPTTVHNSTSLQILSQFRPNVPYCCMPVFRPNVPYCCVITMDDCGPPNRKKRPCGPPIRTCATTSPCPPAGPVQGVPSIPQTARQKMLTRLTDMRCSCPARSKNRKT